MHEIFTHGTAGVGGNVLHGSQLRSGCGHHDGVIHRAAQGEVFHDGCHGGTLLTDGDIDADHILALLVQNGIRGDGGLAGLAVADDQLTLPPANGDHGVDGLDAGLQRHIDGFTVNNAGSRRLNGVVGRRGDGALAVNGVAQRVHNTADQSVAHRHGNDSAGALDDVAFLNAPVVTQDHDGDGLLLQILGHAVGAVGEPAMQLSRPEARAIPSPTMMTVPVSLVSILAS